MTKAALAKALNVSAGRLSHYLKLGMPFPISVPDAETWRDNNLRLSGNKRGPKEAEDEFNLGSDLGPLDIPEINLPEGTDIAARLGRLQDREAFLHGTIKAIESAKPNPRLSGRLAQAHRDWLDVNKLATGVEQALLAMQIRRGELIDAEVSKKQYLDLMMPIIQLIKALPNQGTNEAEQTILARAASKLKQDVVALSGQNAEALSGG